MKLSTRIKKFFFELANVNPFRRRYTATKCGHQTKISGKINVFGRPAFMKMPKNDKGSCDYCLDCISAMSIQCAWCKEPIVIGEPITLYIPKKEFQVPPHAVIYEKNPLQLVGCLSMRCAHSGVDRAGFWLPGENGRGKVYRVATILEQLFAMDNPGGVIVRDLGDIQEAVNPKIIPMNGKGKSST